MFYSRRCFILLFTILLFCFTIFLYYYFTLGLLNDNSYIIGPKNSWMGCILLFEKEYEKNTK